MKNKLKIALVTFGLGVSTAAFALPDEELCSEWKVICSMGIEQACTDWKKYCRRFQDLSNGPIVVAIKE